MNVSHLLPPLPLTWIQTAITAISIQVRVMFSILGDVEALGLNVKR